MPGDATPWDPNDWEKHIQIALKLRYAKPVGTYQHIAAEVGGDYGLEGFATDGTAYQCYACQTWTDSGFLLKKQKTKMTADIGKLIKNEAELLKILGDIRIGIWNFVLPFWNDKELLIHANKKAEEVRKRDPQHVTKDFRISVITGEEFAVEIKALANRDLYQFDVKDIPDSVEADQNVSFYEEQIKLFTAVHNNAVHSIEVAEKDLRAQRAEVMRLRERIRDIRETLVSASSSPSIEAITDRIRLQDRIGRVETQQQVFDEFMAELAELASQWLDVQERLKKLPKGVLSERDIKKISDWQISFQEQLTLYKMGSLDVSDVKISLDTYEPEAEKINLKADVSASDLIRLHWAYLLGLLEVGTRATGNHPGLLIFDEPQQQSVEENAFREMLRHALGEKNCQIIITTSHERESIDSYMKSIGVAHVAEFGTDRILQEMAG